MKTDQKHRATLFLLLIFPLIAFFPLDADAQNAQKAIQRVDEMPDIPEPFEIRDWKSVTRAYDALIFDFDSSGPYLPLIKWDRNRLNFDIDTFYMPSYVGDARQHPGSEEAINTMAVLLGSTLIGIDKSAQNGINWVTTQAQYFNRTTGLLLNNIRRDRHTGQTFWYELYPVIFFSCLVDTYPAVAQEQIPFSGGGSAAPAAGDGTDATSMSMRDIMYANADRYYEAAYHMGGPQSPRNFNFTSFNFQEMKPVWNGRWREPDSAAGIAWVEYMAYVEFGEERFLQAADWALAYFETIDFNPLYESLLPFGAYTAARINAEKGRQYDVGRIIEWCFGPSDARPGWGVLADRWGGFDVHGLMGSPENGGGYAFAMNTFDIAAALVPLVRYDSRYARAVGKWVLNLANNARLFYPGYHAKDHQSSPHWSGDPQNVMAYEGLRKIWDGKSPYATGDPIQHGWGKTDFGLYGSSHVGLLASIVSRTNIKKILRLDLLATDFFREPAYPSYLYYNPYDVAKSVRIDVDGIDTGRWDVYSPTEKRFLARDAADGHSITIEPKKAVVVVLTPPGGAVANDKGKLTVNGVAVDCQPVAAVIESPRSGDTVSGTVRALLDIVAASDIDLQHVSLFLDGEPVYSDSAIPELPGPAKAAESTTSVNAATASASPGTPTSAWSGIEINTAELTDLNTHMLTVRVEGTAGVVATDTIHFTVDNRPLSQNNARDFAAWKPADQSDGQLRIKGHSATLEVVSRTADSAAVISPEIELDFDRLPVLVFDGFYPRGDWSFSIELDNGRRIEIQPSIKDDNYVEIDLVEGLRRAGLPANGKRRVRLILAVEQKNAKIFFFHDNVEIIYGGLSK